MKRVKWFLFTAVLLALIFLFNFVSISLEEAQPPNMVLVVQPASVSDVLADSGFGQTAEQLFDSYQNENSPPFCFVIVEPFAACDEGGDPCRELLPEFYCQPEGGATEGGDWLRAKLEEFSLTLLSTEYSGRYYSGSQLWVTTSYPDGCSGGYYQLPNLGDVGWDGKISSVQTNIGANCAATILYDYAGYGGGSITASPNLSVLGAMDNAASSLKVFP